jgi:hypothetical protein
MRDFLPEQQHNGIGKASEIVVTVYIGQWVNVDGAKYLTSISAIDMTIQF